MIYKNAWEAIQNEKQTLWNKKELKKMLRNYWFLDELDAAQVRLVAKVWFHEDYGGK